MLKKNQIIMNEGYDKKDILFSKGVGSHIYIKNKKYLDLSFCAGTNLLGHNSPIYKNAVKQLIKNDVSNFAAKNLHAEEFSKNTKKTFPKYSKFIFCNSALRLFLNHSELQEQLLKKI